MTTVYDNQSIAFRDLSGNTATISPNVGFTIATPLKTLTADVDGFNNGTQNLSFMDLYGTVEKARAIKFDTSTETKLSVRDTVEIIDDDTTPTQKNSITQKSISLSAVGLSNNIEISNNLLNEFDEAIDPFIRITKSDPNKVATFYADNLAMTTPGLSTNLYLGSVSVSSSSILTAKDVEISATDCSVNLNHTNEGVYGKINEKSVLFSKTGLPDRIEINNSPDGSTNNFPYLQIHSEDVQYKYTSNLTSEGHRQILKDTADNLLHQIDVKPTEISFDNKGTDIGTNYTGGIGAFYVSQSVDTTTANLFMSYGNRLNLTYNDNSRKIDIFNDKDNEPYMEIINSNSTTISTLTGDSLTFATGVTTNSLNAQQWSGNIQTVNTVSPLTHYINFSDSSGTGYGKPQKNALLSCIPSTGTLVATTFSGSLNGNASSSSAVSLTSDNTDTPCYIPFSKNVASNSALFIDNTTTPLTYNPSTSTLSTSNLSIVEKIEVVDTITPTYRSELIPTSLTITEISSTNYSSLGYNGFTSVNTAGVSNTLTPNDMVISNTINGETNTIDQNSITMTSPLGTLNQVIISNDISGSEPFIRIDDSAGRPTLYYNYGITSDSGFCYTLNNGTRFLKQQNPFSFKFTELLDGDTIEPYMPFVMVQNVSGINLRKVSEYVDDLGEVGWSCIISNYGNSITVDISNASGWYGGASSGLDANPIVIRQFCTVRITLVYSRSDGYIWAVSRF
jgi:hypothetical protein